MAITERKIGEEFLLGNVNLRVEKCYEWNSCLGCYIACIEGQCSDYYSLTGKCLRGDREDKQDVKFVKVK